MKENIREYTLKNEKLTVKFMNYGAYITHVLLENGQNVVMNYADIDSYFDDKHCLNCFVGPVIGRIANAEFTLEGKEYKLEKNEGEHNLHSGSANLATKFWDVDVSEEDTCAVLTYRTKDGEGGFPGNVDVSVTYKLKGETLVVKTEAETDKPTLFAPSLHFHFNLEHFEEDIENHLLKISSQKFTELTEEVIPTGTLLNVEDTPFDFREDVKIGSFITKDDPQLNIEGGYDHGFLLQDKEVVLKNKNKTVELHATTTEPAVVIYTNNGLTEKEKINEGRDGFKHGAICIELQKLPDAIHHENFPSVVLYPEKPFQEESRYTFRLKQ
jgi:aldose 1-epimerase